jgi:hypothetical protein
MKTTTTLLALAASTGLAFSQGPLTPSAAPAATMKTLAQIEARTPISASPAVPIAGPHFTITQPGSYYLTGNVEVTSGDGIRINASNVALDLNGFTLISATVTPASGSAILIVSGNRNIQIKNGSITGGAVSNFNPVLPSTPADYTDVGWSSGIEGFSVEGSFLLSNLTVERCKNSGIYISGGNPLLENISVTGNGGNGVAIGGGSITNSVAHANGGIGIGNFGGSIMNTRSSFNGSHGISASGGSVMNSNVSNNAGDGIAAYQGSVTNSTAASSGGHGIYAFGGSVTNSRATSNAKSGILISEGVAAHCVASGNITGGFSTDRQIKVTAGGQRSVCVPATEAGSP